MIQIYLDTILLMTIPDNRGINTIHFLFHLKKEGFESPFEWSELLKLDNFSYLHAKKWKIGNDPWCVLTPISLLLLGQNWKSRTVLKSSGRADFKTDLPFWIWWTFYGDIDKKQTWNFFCRHSVLNYFLKITKIFTIFWQKYLEYLAAFATVSLFSSAHSILNTGP